MARLCNDLFDPSWMLHRTFSNEIGMSQTLFKYLHCDWRLWPNPVSHTSPPSVGEVWAVGQRRDHTSKKNVQAQCPMLNVRDVPTLKLHTKVRKMRSLMFVHQPSLYYLFPNHILWNSKNGRPLVGYFSAFTVPSTDFCGIQLSVDGKLN